VSRDVKFKERLAPMESQEPLLVTEDEEKKAPKDEKCSTTSSSRGQPSYGEEETLDPPNHVKRPWWFTQKENVESPKRKFRERKPLKKFPNYVALISRFIDDEPSNFEEAENQQVWRDAMVEYTSIMKNDVWYIVLILEENLVVSPSGYSR
jgi:hypothetical protein